MKYKMFFLVSILFSMLFIGCNNEFIKSSGTELGRLVPQALKPGVQWLGGSDLYIDPLSDPEAGTGKIAEKFYAVLIPNDNKVMFAGTAGDTIGGTGNYYTYDGGSEAMAAITVAGKYISATSAEFAFDASTLGSTSIGQTLSIALQPAIFAGKDKGLIQNSTLNLTVTRATPAVYAKYLLENASFAPLEFDLDTSEPTLEDQLTKIDGTTTDGINGAINAVIAGHSGLDTKIDSITITHGRNWTAPAIPWEGSAPSPSWPGLSQTDYTINVPISSSDPIPSNVTAEIVIPITLFHTAGTGAP